MADLITINRATVEQVLEALVWEAGPEPALYAAQTDKAITALRAALAQAEPVQEPFALPCPTPKACREHCCSGHCIPRATSPQQAEPVQRTPATGAAPCVPSPSFQMTTQAEPPCDHCRSPLFAARQCRVCGRKAEPK